MPTITELIAAGNANALLDFGDVTESFVQPVSISTSRLVIAGLSAETSVLKVTSKGDDAGLSFAIAKAGSLEISSLGVETSSGGVAVSVTGDGFRLRLRNMVIRGGLFVTSESVVEVTLDECEFVGALIGLSVAAAAGGRIRIRRSRVSGAFPIVLTGPLDVVCRDCSIHSDMPGGAGAVLYGLASARFQRSWFDGAGDAGVRILPSTSPCDDTQLVHCTSSSSIPVLVDASEPAELPTFHGLWLDGCSHDCSSGPDRTLLNVPSTGPNSLGLGFIRAPFIAAPDTSIVSLASGIEVLGTVARERAGRAFDAGRPGGNRLRRNGNQGLWLSDHLLSTSESDEPAVGRLEVDTFKLDAPFTAYYSRFIESHDLDLTLDTAEAARLWVFSLLIRQSGASRPVGVRLNLTDFSGVRLGGSEVPVLVQAYWQRISWPLTLSAGFSGGALSLSFHGGPGTIHMSSPQLEPGNEPTDYQPALDGGAAREPRRIQAKMIGPITLNAGPPPDPEFGWRDRPGDRYLALEPQIPRKGGPTEYDGWISTIQGHLPNGDLTLDDVQCALPPPGKLFFPNLIPPHLTDGPLHVFPLEGIEGRPDPYEYKLPPQPDPVPWDFRPERLVEQCRQILEVNEAKRTKRADRLRG